MVAKKASDKELLEKKSKEAVKTLDSFLKTLRKSVIKDFGKVKIKYKEGVIVKKMRARTASELRKIAQVIEGKKA